MAAVQLAGYSTASLGPNGFYQLQPILLIDVSAAPLGRYAFIASVWSTTMANYRVNRTCRMLQQRVCIHHWGAIVMENELNHLLWLFRLRVVAKDQ